MSSPYVRCVQTLEPLAQLMGQPVMTDHRLAEGNDFRAVFELFAALTDGAVLCSHGDVIPEVIGALERRGCAFTSSPDWRKASVWVLRREDAGDIVSAKAWAPPDA
jgi:8-oxo-dGTP diphosphatase